MQPSQNNHKLKIYFRDEEIDNIKVIFVRTNIEWNARNTWEENKLYTSVRVYYDCNGLHIVGEGIQDGETYIPTTSIKRFMVDYLPGHKYDKP